MKMTFKEFNAVLQENFKNLTKDVDSLYEVNVDKTELWERYINSFPEGANEIYRERQEYDCSCCRQFIKSFGRVVKLKDGKITSIWNFKVNDRTYQTVLDSLTEYVESIPLSDVWINKEKKIGVEENYEKLDNGEILTWNHFCLHFPNKLVVKSSKSENELRGTLASLRSVFYRSLKEISLESIESVLDLINQKILYKGEEWHNQLMEFAKHKKEFENLGDEKLERNYSWEHFNKIPFSLARIKNTSIGTLLVNISEGENLEDAVKKYEKIVAPENYKRSKPIYTKKMLEDAKKTIAELGYGESLNRRYATIDDISVNDIMFINKNDSNRKASFDVFEEMEKEVSVNPNKFSNTKEISIDDFLKDVLPKAENLEILLENRLERNMMSLITSENKDAKTMFKWDNSFSWAYNGNIADSTMKENVFKAGGKVDGDLRFSIQWNNGEKHNPNDFDAHCIEPNGNEIYYGSKRSSSTTGTLDVDITDPSYGKAAVENITWGKKENMLKGEYSLFVNNYCHKGGRDGFEAEVEFDGEIHTFVYNKELKHEEKIYVADVYFDGNNFTLKNKLPSTTTTKEMWNLHTNQFVPVSMISLSPNYWGDNKVGNKHFFFILKDCVNKQSPNGFYNEFLNEELMKNRRVMEALGSKLAVVDAEQQLSGLGMSSTKRNEIIVKAKIGNKTNVMKVKF